MHVWLRIWIRECIHSHRTCMDMYTYCCNTYLMISYTHDNFWFVLYIIYTHIDITSGALTQAHIYAYRAIHQSMDIGLVIRPSIHFVHISKVPGHSIQRSISWPMEDRLGRFLSHGGTPNHPSHDHFSIETHGFGVTFRWSHSRRSIDCLDCY
jgi:hypothetical protein